MNSQAIIFGSNGLLRSGWRAAIFVGVFTVAAFFLGAVGYAILLAFGIEAGTNNRASLVVSSVLLLLAPLVIGWLCGKYLERLPFKTLGASFEGRWFRHLGLGLLFGVVALVLVVAIAWAFGGLSFEINSGVDASAIATELVILFLIFAAGAAFEEALFRGYILQTFARSGLAWLAIALTSLFFGVVHLGNENVSWIGAVNTMLAGVMFAVAYLKTRDLWFPFGIHLMWNWTQSAVFGIEVSGMNDIAAYTLLKEIDRGPIWLTGESYGIEGGVACTIALLATIVLIRFMPDVKPLES